MRIAFYAPTKPLKHARVSGDITIARDVMDFFVKRGHSTAVASPLETTWLYWKPWRWADAALEYVLARQTCSSQGIQAWLTYRSTAVSPDILGPRLARLGLPYFIFSGSCPHSEKATPKTWIGHRLNTRALNAADHVFVARKEDFESCAGVLPPEKLTYVRPGLPLRLFAPDVLMRQKFRRKWGARQKPVVISSAVMRSGRKADGIETVIHACAELVRGGRDLMLIVTGDGPERDRLERLALNLMPGQVRFPGMIPRAKLYEVFSAADIFALPGINEGLGMMYLEAESCGLPVLATDGDCAPEVVEHGETGIIVPNGNAEEFTAALARLIDDAALRSRLGRAARALATSRHDITTSYSIMENIMKETVERKGHSWGRMR
ncbi:glycosyltransferase involved in cell wall biosynthesis [Desulfobaculum xiamenense]|uniref:Glycosyltransferase involved in cell wall biosynthesis n=1 Tax=Desulfobaculum xiamenense TaxID=995050 RepID=A0A846QQR3_9BACT|nr:glycosyltransferase family 4 protein [Desulfobaculum xiamenense]NJB69517.1 glycosyltransferase involved in cell wall biosynthesis [Desulfobaculum xiamenense]